MDFNIKKPLHILALLLILLTFIVIIMVPILSFFNIFPSLQSMNFEEMTRSWGIFFEIFALAIQLAMFIFTLILVPIVWYLFVNKLSLKQSLKQMRLTLKNIDIAFLWAILSIIIIFVIYFVFVYFLISFGVDPEDLGNIQDLEVFFSPVTLFLLISIQPIGEEIFFRGFLLEKIEGSAGKNIAIVTTAVLFGLAHMSYGKVYPVIFPIIIGLILGYIVIKTNNLYSSIMAHVLFNVISFVLAILARSLV